MLIAVVFERGFGLGHPRGQGEPRREGCKNQAVPCNEESLRQKQNQSRGQAQLAACGGGGGGSGRAGEDAGEVGGVGGAGEEGAAGDVLDFFYCGVGGVCYR